MLVLSRKPGETIQIGPGISITVVEVRGGQIRLAIDAPRHVPVFRQELLASQVQHAEDNGSRRSLVQ